MLINCPECGTEYDVTLGLNGCRVQCNTCDHKFIVELSVSSSPKTAEEDVTPSAEPSEEQKSDSGLNRQPEVPDNRVTAKSELMSDSAVRPQDTAKPKAQVSFTTKRTKAAPQKRKNALAGSKSPKKILTRKPAVAKAKRRPAAPSGGRRTPAAKRTPRSSAKVSGRRHPGKHNSHAVIYIITGIVAAALIAGAGWHFTVAHKAAAAVPRDIVSLPQIRKKPLSMEVPFAYSGKDTKGIEKIVKKAETSTNGWRKAANERIDKYRKSNFDLWLVNKRNKPIKGATVRIVLQRHAFRFGGVIPIRTLFGSTPDVMK